MSESVQANHNGSSSKLGQSYPNLIVDIFHQKWFLWTSGDIGSSICTSETLCTLCTLGACTLCAHNIYMTIWVSILHAFTSEMHFSVPKRITDRLLLLLLHRQLNMHFRNLVHTVHTWCMHTLCPQYLYDNMGINTACFYLRNAFFCT